MNSLIRDIKYAARMFAKQPGFTLVALVTLALGIGANTGMFSLVNAIEGVSNRFEDPEQLVLLYRTTERYRRAPVCPIDYLDWREQTKSFSDIGLHQGASFTLTGQGEPEQIDAVQTTANLLPMLGLNAKLGRLHTEEEDAPTGERVVLLTYKLWQNKFAADPDVLGRVLTLDDQPYTVIGVLPPEFELDNMWFGVELLTPLRIDPHQKRGEFGRCWAVGRLDPGVSIEQAQTEMDHIASRLAEAHPASNEKTGVLLQPLRDAMVSPESRMGNRVLLASVGLVLLITCANLANLLLAKAASRNKEFAVRTALGAGRARIVRQLLTESLLLAALGGLFGLLLGSWMIDLFIASMEFLPIQRAEVALNWRILIYTAVVSGIAALTFGLTPALTATRVSVNHTLKEGYFGVSSGHSRNRLRNALIVGQLAIAMPLLICCGLTVRHLIAYRTVEFGYKTDPLLTLRTVLPSRRYAAEAQQAAFYRDVLEKIEALPGIERAGATLRLPVLSSTALGARITIEDLGEESGAEEADVRGYVPVTPGFFETLQAPLISGRFFTTYDRDGSLPVAIINRRMAERYWPEQDPIGRRVKLATDSSEGKWVTVVGIVADVGRSVRGSNPAPPVSTLYVPLQQWPYSDLYIIVQTIADPKNAITSVRNAIHELDAGVPVEKIRTVQDVMHDFCRDDRLAAGFLLGLAALALGLAGLGLYGVTSFNVLQQTHEIGIRVALGADRRQIIRMVLRRCLRLTVIGIVVGLVLAVPTGLAIQSQLYRVKGIDPLAYLGVSLVLLAVTALAGYLPARRATKVDPITALRCE